MIPCDTPSVNLSVSGVFPRTSLKEDFFFFGSCQGILSHYTAPNVGCVFTAWPCVMVSHRCYLTDGSVKSWLLAFHHTKL